LRRNRSSPSDRRHTGGRGRVYYTRLASITSSLKKQKDSNRWAKRDQGSDANIASRDTTINVNGVAEHCCDHHRSDDKGHYVLELRIQRFDHVEDHAQGAEKRSRLAASVFRKATIINRRYSAYRAGRDHTDAIHSKLHGDNVETGLAIRTGVASV